MVGSTLQAIQSFEYWQEIGEGTADTLIMTALSLVFTVLIGLPIGVALFLTSWRQRSERPLVARIQGWVYKTLSLLVNVLRSLPFLILLILLILVFLHHLRYSLQWYQYFDYLLVLVLVLMLC